MLPTDSGASSLLIYFKSIEELYSQYKIEDDIKILLLYTKLPDRVRKLLGNLETAEKDTYEKVKNIILQEYQISPSVCRRGFMDCAKFANESGTQFISRLKSLLKCYLESRNIGESFAKLTDLLICDKFKECITRQERYFLCDREGMDWLPSTELGKLVDLHQAVRLEDKGQIQQTGNKYYGQKYNQTGRNTDNDKSKVQKDENRIAGGTSQNTSYNNVISYNDKSFKNDNQKSYKTEIQKGQGYRADTKQNNSYKTNLYKTRMVDVPESDEGNDENEEKENSGSEEERQDEEQEEDSQSKQVNRVIMSKELQGEKLKFEAVRKSGFHAQNVDLTYVKKI